MRVVVFGATGGIGRNVVEHALAAGHEVRAVVRESSRPSTSSGVDTMVGEITDAAAVGRATEGMDAVVWAVGATRNTADQPPLFETGARTVVAAMRQHDVRRLVALSGAGITVAGEHKPLTGRLMTALVKVAARHVYEAKRREYEVFAVADIDWTLVRPPRVVEGGPTGRAVLGSTLRGSTVSQGDVGAVMVAQLEDRTYLRAAPFVSA